MVLNSSAQSGQAHSCIRPLDCGVSLAAGLYGDARTGSESITRALKLFPYIWFSRSRPNDRLPLRYPPTCLHSSRYRARHSDGRREFFVDFFFRHHRPGDARHPVGQRHCDQHPRLARQHPRQQRTRRRAGPPSAPVISSRLRSRWPIFDILHSRALPPGESPQGRPLPALRWTLPATLSGPADSP